MVPHFYFGEKMENLRDKALKIKWFILDVDGVLTDGKIIYDTQGKELKQFNVKDGLGINLLHRAGIKTAIITSRNSSIVEKRASELGITEVIQNAKNKLEAYIYLKEKFNITDEEILYVGDDLVDIPILKRVGFPVCVKDAVNELKDLVVYVTRKKGGEGAVREIAELILKLQGKYEEVIKDYYR
ncbi:HAD-IIIA family hydrolase [Persephonella sp. IF05-L8]|uniref:KdsC family phosphatase n=1 Tax=Persephonella sp. IF05-L8 TaxID=1158338 RepID=UPI0030B9CFDE